MRRRWQPAHFAPRVIVGAHGPRTRADGTSAVGPAVGATSDPVTGDHPTGSRRLMRGARRTPPGVRSRPSPVRDAYAIGRHAHPALAFALSPPFLLLASTALAAGSIQGTVKVAKPCLPPPRGDQDASVCSKDAPNESVLVDKKGGLRNVVVFINDARFAGKVAPVANAADRRRCRRPHVQALTVGTPLALMNNDAILHNVHANDTGMTVFNVAMPIKGQKLPIPMRKPGSEAPVRCRPHLDERLDLRLRPPVLRRHRRQGRVRDQGRAARGDHGRAVARARRRTRGGVRTTARVKVADGAPSSSISR